MRKNIFKINFNGNIGTGVLLNLFEDGYGIIVTACHCMENIQVSNAYGQVYDTISFDSALNIKTMYVWKSGKNEDMAILVVKFQESMLDLGKGWTITEDINPKIPLATLSGFPCEKKSEKSDFDCRVKELTYDENQNLYVGSLLDWPETDKTMLMQGMSGSPVYDETSNTLYGIYLGSQEDEFRYDECRITPIQNVIRFARDNNILYYKKFSYNEGIGLYNKNNRYFLNEKEQAIYLNLNKYKDLSFLLIGKSGQGKSTFIKSFLKHSDQISSTGEGRTTRVNCEYKVYYSDHDEPRSNYIHIKFLNKDKFVKLRLRQIEKKLEQLSSSCNKQELYGILCRITGFFEMNEFGKRLVEKTEAVFEDIFLDAKGEIKPEVFAEKSDQEKTVYDYAEDFYERVFEALDDEKCFNNRKLELDKDLSDEDMEFLTKCFKSVSPQTASGRDEREAITTYTGMIDKIEIQDRICDEYVDLCEQLKIRQITFVDTYGLDHQSHEDEAQIEERLEHLLNVEYPQIKNVLYIRKLSSDSPADLEYYLPALYRIDAVVALNVVFTGADQNTNFTRAYDEGQSVDLLEMNAKSNNRNSAVNYFEKPIPKSKYDPDMHSLQMSILNVAKSKKYAENMFNAIVKRLTPYCAPEDKNTYQRFFDNNYRKLYALLKAVIDKEYMGTGIIDVENYEENLNKIRVEENNEMREVLDKLLSQVFQKASMEWGYSNYHRGHWKTKQANYNHIREIKLGYLGVHDDRWASRFKGAYNEVFSTLDENDFEVLFHENKSTIQGIAIQHLLNAFKKEMIGCTRDGMDLFYTGEEACVKCKNKEECFKYKLIKTYGKETLSKGLDEEEKDHSKWLNNRCNFEQKYQENKEEFMNYFIEKFSLLKEEFRAHNDKILQGLLGEDTNFVELIKHVQIFLKNLPDELQKHPDYIVEYVKKSIKE